MHDAGAGEESSGSAESGVDQTSPPGAGDYASEFLDLERELAVFLRRARASSGEMAREVHPELESSAYGLLVRLEDAGPQRATALAAYFGVGKATMSRQLRTMEDLGLVARTPDPADGRAWLVHLTEEGRDPLRTGAGRAPRAVRAAARVVGPHGDRRTGPAPEPPQRAGRRRRHRGRLTAPVLRRPRSPATWTLGRSPRRMDGPRPWRGHGAGPSRPCAGRARDERAGAVATPAAPGRAAPRRAGANRRWRPARPGGRSRPGRPAAVRRRVSAGRGSACSRRSPPARPGRRRPPSTASGRSTSSTSRRPAR